MRAVLLFATSLLSIPCALAVDDPRDQKRQQVLDVLNDEARFALLGANASSGLGRFGRDERMCGIAFPIYDLRAFEDNDVEPPASLGNGAYGETKLVTLRRNYIDAMNEREKRLLTPKMVFKKPLDKHLWWANKQAANRRELKKINAEKTQLVTTFLLEAIVGHLSTSASLPETPVASLAGVGSIHRDPDVWFHALSVAGQAELFNVLHVSDPISGKGRKGTARVSKKAKPVKVWQEFASTFSVFPDPTEALPRGATQAEREAHHNRKMAQEFDASLALIQQLLIGVQHFHDLQIHHGDLKPENTLLSGKNGVKIIDFGLADLSFDYFRDPQVEAADPAGPSSLKVTLPEAFRGYSTQGNCAPLAAAQRGQPYIALQNMLQASVDMMGGTSGYIAPIRYLSANREAISNYEENGLAFHLMGPRQLHQLASDRRKYHQHAIDTNNEMFAQMTVPALSKASDLWAIAIIAMQLLTGNIFAEVDAFSSEPCRHPELIDGVTLADSYGLHSYCDAWPNPLPKELKERQELWNAMKDAFHGINFAKWLDDDKIELFKKALPVSVTGIESFISLLDDLKDFGKEKKQQQIQGANAAVQQAAQQQAQQQPNAANNVDDEDDDEAIALDAIGVRVPTISEDTGRRRLYAWLHAMTRFTPSAQHAVATGKRALVDDGSYDHRFVEVQAEAKADAEVEVGATATPSPGPAVPPDEMVFKEGPLGKPLPPCTIDASTSSCPPGFWVARAAQGNRASIPRFLSKACKRELREINCDLNKVQVNNLPTAADAVTTATATTTTAGSAPSSLGIGPQQPAAAAAAVAAPAAAAPPQSPPANALNIGPRPAWPPQSPASGNAVNLGPRPAWPPAPQSKPQPPRFLRAGSGLAAEEQAQADAESELTVGEDEPELADGIVYSRSAFSAQSDSPLGWFWNTAPRLDGKVDVVVAPSFVISKGNNKNDYYDLASTMVDQPISDAFPRYGFIDLRAVPRLRGTRQTTFRVTEAELRNSAEGAPHVKNIRFSARRATAGILDLIRGLLSLHATRRIEVRDAITTFDDIRFDALAELKGRLPDDVLKAAKQNWRSLLRCTFACANAVRQFKAQQDPQQLSGEAICQKMSTEQTSTTMPHCPAVVDELFKYSVDGTPFTTLVKSDRGITAASFESLCRYKICAKGSPALVPQPDHAWVQQGVRHEQQEQASHVIPAEGWNQDNTGAIQLDGGAQLVPLISGEGGAEVMVIGDANSNAAQQQPQQPQQQQPPQRKMSISNPGGYEAVSVPKGTKKEIRIGLRGFFLGKSFAKAKVVGASERNPRVLAKAVARKGPVSAKFWTGFDGSSKTRLFELFLDHDPVDRDKTRVLIRWNGPADKAIKKRLKKEGAVPAKLADFHGGLVAKTAKPLYLHPAFPGAFACDKLHDLQRTRPDLGIPPLHDKCGSYQTKYPNGMCLCVVLGAQEDHLTPHKVLRMFFRSKVEAKAFMGVSQELIAAALASPEVRQQPKEVVDAYIAAGHAAADAAAAAAGGGGEKKAKKGK